MAIVHECCLAKLGSRIALDFRPRDRMIRYSAIGQFFDIPMDVAVGVRMGDQVRTLPFTKRHPHFETTEQELRLTSVTFRGESRELGVRLVACFRAPYYPYDEKLSVAPFFEVDLAVERLVPRSNDPAKIAQPIQGEVFFEIKAPQMRITTTPRSIRMSYEIQATHRFLKEKYLAMSPKEAVKEFRCRDMISSSKRLSGSKFRIPGNQWRTDAMRIFWAGHTSKPVLVVKGKFLTFKYSKWFKSAAEVIAFARKAREDYLEKCALIDSILEMSSLGKLKRDLLAFSFQGWMANTWWCVYPDGRDWFSCWEGSCHYHSTVDVEYNAAWVNLLLWPELLEMTIRQWHGYVKEGGIMSHDTGDSFMASGQFYRHDMPVEENTNFILLTYALWRFTGRKRVIRENFSVVKTLAEYIINADKTGNGFPNVGTANTVDDATPAVQSAGEQVYLGIKSYCALTAAAIMARELGNTAFAQIAENLCRKIRRTLDRDGWCGDHYGVTLLPEGSEAVDMLSKQKHRVQGASAYSLYTANGALYLLATDTELGLNRKRLRKDIQSALIASKTEYGCTHSSADKGNVWISQNVWRDLVAAHLGIDLVDMAERYWAFELFENTQGRGACFIDTYGWNYLRYYPRGAVTFGLLYALGGVRTDMPARKLVLRPVRVPCRIPLLGFADWKRGRIPWVEFGAGNGKTTYNITNEKCLHGIKVSLRPPESIPGRESPEQADTIA